MSPDLSPVRDLLSDPDNWTQGGMAFDIGGEPVQADDGDAVCWCLMGAVEKTIAPDDVNHALKKIATAINPDARDWEVTIVDWNDHPDRTHSEVMELLEKVQ